MPRPLARLRARAEAIFQRRVLLALRVLREQVDVPALARVLQSSLPSQAIATLPIDEVLGARLRSDFMRIFRDTYESGGDQAARRLKATLVGKDIDYTVRVNTFAFDVLNRRGLDFLQRHGADRVTQITETTRQALRELLTRLYLEGVPALEQAKRIKEVVGLTTQHAQAVENLRERLTEQGVAPVRVERLAERKAWQLLDLRALTIARTESAFAASAGQTESWHQAADEGLFNPAEATRTWNTAEDESTCPICMPMDGQTVGFNEPFVTGDGEMADDPPLHPACRCDTTLQPTARREEVAA